jgi:hypothetical protein
MSHTLRGAAAAVAVLALASSAQAGLISVVATTRTGDPARAVVTFDDATAPGHVRVTVAVDTSLCLADINGFFFNLRDESLLAGLSVSGDVTLTVKKADAVTSAGPGNNVNGAGIGPFDVGVRIGSPGIGEDDVQTANFVLSHPTAGLTNDLFAGVANEEGNVFAVRLTSVGEPGSDREGSSKLCDEVVIAPVPTPEPSTLAGFATAGVLVLLVRRFRGARV